MSDAANNISSTKAASWKTSGRQLPKKPPKILTSKLEKKAWAELWEIFAGGHAWAEHVDIAACVLCAQRMASVEHLQTIAKQVIQDKQEIIKGGNGQVKIHPIFAELRAAEHGLNQSLGSLYLTPRARNNARTGGAPVDPHADRRNASGKAGADILK